MGLLCVVLGIKYLPVGVLAIWFGLCWIVMGAAYAKPGTNLFGKNESGQIPLRSKLIFFPCLVFTHIVWHLACRVAKEDPYNRLDDELIVGRRLLPHEMPEEVTHVLDLTTEFSEPAAIVDKKHYIHFPIMDAHIPERAALASLLDGLPNDGVLYIHCAQGHGRTGTVALATLATRKQINNVKDGLTLLQGKRPLLNINSEQTRFVEAYLQGKTELNRDKSQ